MLSLQRDGLPRAPGRLGLPTQYAEAKPLYRKALAVREKAPGPEHPNVATILENYAKMLRKTKRRDGDAAKLEARAKHAQKK